MHSETLYSATFNSFAHFVYILHGKKRFFVSLASSNTIHQQLPGLNVAQLMLCNVELH